MSANNIAYTSLVNAPGEIPLTREQVWAGLLLKIRSAETFVPAAISKTNIISESTDPNTGNAVTVREVEFRESGLKVQETVVAYEPTRVDFEQDGGHISNIISQGGNGLLYMTYVFEWRHPGVSKEELANLLKKQQDMAQLAVEGTLKALRKLVEEKKL